MRYHVGEKSPELPTQGLLRAGGFLWARALPWSAALAIALWLVYKFVKRVGIDLGLGGTGVPTELGVLAALASYVVGVHLVERRSPNELAVRDLAPELGVGFALGAAVFSGVIGVLLATEAYAVTGLNAEAPWGPLADSLEGAVEELIFRGAIFRLLWTAFGVFWALGLSSALFGMIHLSQPGADLMAVLGVAFGGGIPLAALYVLSGRLWPPIGYHIGWNFTEAYVFGAEISGRQLGASMFQVRPVAGVSRVWSGGAFGPEASMATLIMGLLVGAALLALAKHRT